MHHAEKRKSLFFSLFRLNDCDLTDEDCVSLASPLILNFSNLRELDLSENKLGDFGVKLLLAGPESHLSKLATFK